MAITLIDGVDGEIIDSVDYNSNNATLESALNSLDGTNLQAGTVANSALINSESIVPIYGGVRDAGSQNFYIPIYTTQDIVVDGWRWFITDAGTGNGSCTIRHGTIVSGAFSSAGTIVNGATITTTGVDTQCNAGGGVLGVTIIPSTSTVIEVAFTAGTLQNSISADEFNIMLYGKTELTT